MKDDYIRDNVSIIDSVSRSETLHEESNRERVGTQSRHSSTNGAGHSIGYHKLNLADVQISRLDSHFDFRGRRFTLKAAFKEIEKGNSTVGQDYGSECVNNDNYKSLSLREATEKARHHRSTNREAYDFFKRNLPAYCFGCTLDGRSPDQPTSVLGIDLDNIENMANAKKFAISSPYTLACFTTLGGKGLRILAKVDPTPTPETHRYAWFAVRNTYKFIAEADPAGKEMNKLSALVYDPEISVNENSYPINWGVDHETFLSEFPHADIEQQALGNLPDEYRAAIEDLTYKENGKGWSRERLPCLFKFRDGETHENDGWGYRSNAMEVRKIDGGYEVRCHKCDGRTEQFVASIRKSKVCFQSVYSEIRVTCRTQNWSLINFSILRSLTEKGSV